MITDAIITVEGLYKEFGHGKVHALNGVDAQVRKGEVLVVIGPSGSGKSTFLRCLNLLELPTRGKITFEGVDIPLDSGGVLRQAQAFHAPFFCRQTVLRQRGPGMSRQNRVGVCIHFRNHFS